MLSGMQIGSMHDWCYVLCIRQRLQSLIAYIDRVLNGSLPVRVLINYSRQDLGKVIAVRVPDESPQDLRTPICLDAILDVFAAESKVRFSFHHPQQQVVSRQLRNDGLPQEDAVQDVYGVLRLQLLRLVVELAPVVGAVAYCKENLELFTN